ncbi:MAG: ABC transporter ATP-binding protein [Bacteroidota bacterium]
MLTAHNIHKSYGNLQVLKGVSIELQPGEVVALIGASGAGKSTLLQILGTLDEADSGSISFQGKSVDQMSERQKAQFRNLELGFVFQFHHLLPEFTALENVCIPGMIAEANQSAIQTKATELLTKLGLANRMHHKPSQLSGGEQQRVSMARALINGPKLILADEPTGNLDTRNSKELYNLIYELAQTTGVAFLIATHNPTLAGEANRVMEIEDGLMV